MIHLLLLISLVSTAAIMGGEAAQQPMSTFESIMASPHLDTKTLTFEKRDKLEAFLNDFDAARLAFYEAAAAIGSNHKEGIEILQELLNVKGFQIVCDLIPQFEEADADAEATETDRAQDYEECTE